jgi:hypothetical protein
MKKFLIGLSMLMFSAPAMAADLGNQGGGFKDDALSNVVGPCAGVSWTGFRIGLGVGVGQTGLGSGTESSTSGNVISTDVVNGGYQMETVGQVELGYDYQFRNSPLVIGAFGNLGYGSGPTQFTYGADVRAGLAWGNALFYGFVGYEKSHLAHDLTNTTGSAVLASMKADPDGVAFGAGVDVNLGRGWYAGVRAERVDYGLLTATGTGATNIAYKADISGTDDRGLLTLGYKF